ncbi:hypothetical protein [Streptomyces sp. WM6378]|uniref:hypothetical protein n=1 Tax=Streptomyces sp. WM6378 TaxID=1415557 RepID=UPI0006ADA150|nr:hypothetical protein [Streptomyces sp. WM6378]KOU43189.1 hypothetical protein ADK54_17845 [Streptomyces sp. WM6378]
MLYEQNDEVDEILARYARPLDPENCTEDDLAQLLGRNWRDVVSVIRQAADLTYEQAEKITKCGRDANWELDLEQAHNTLLGTGHVESDVGWDAQYEAGAIDDWERFSDFGTVYDAFVCASMAATAGDAISERMHRDLMYSWRSAF